MTAHYKPTTANEIIREHAEQVVRDSRERCGHLSDDGRSVCRFLKGHGGEHGQHMNVTRPEQCANCGKVKAEHTREGDAWYCWPRSDFPTTSSMTTGRYLEQFVPPASAPAATPEPEGVLLTVACDACNGTGNVGPGQPCQWCSVKATDSPPTGEEAETLKTSTTEATMTTMSPVPADAPLMRAWTAYRKTTEYANSQNWAHYPKHIEGSMWAAFEAGFTAQATTLAALRARETELTALLRRVEHDLMTVPYNAQTPFDVISGVAAAIRAALAPRQPTGSQP